MRMYSAARSSRLTAGFPGWNNTSADAELATSLTQLRSRSRQLCRDAGYAKRARTLFTNNVVGGGVGLQAKVDSTRGNKRQALNSAIEAAWRAWSRAANCHTGGTLHFHELERLACAELFEAGEVLIVLHERRVGDSRVPVALELVEAERLADEYTTPGGAVPSNVRMGVELDDYFRPVAYWIRQTHPGDIRGNLDGGQRYVRVPAERVLHLKITERFPQTRGVPMMHAAIRKLHDMDEYSAAELTAARMSAIYFATITSDADNPLAATLDEAGGDRRLDLEPGVVEKLAPGENLDFHAPNRPNAALDAFMRAMLREVASGLSITYASLSSDFSQTNYSSSRLALLDDRDVWRCFQQFWVRSFREPLHRFWMTRAVAAGAINGLPAEQFFADPDRYCEVRWKLRGWSWVDPVKEVQAYKEAVRAGFMTISRVIEMTGSGDDFEDFIEQRRAELEQLAAAGIEVDTTVTVPSEPTAPPGERDDAEPTANDPQQRVVSLRR